MTYFKVLTKNSRYHEQIGVLISEFDGIYELEFSQDKTISMRGLFLSHEIIGYKND